MYKSLIRHCPKANLYIICLDDKLYNYLNQENFSNIIPFSLKEVETSFHELKTAKQNRTYVEYIFTLSPIIALFIFKQFPHLKMVTTLDADIYFFSDPSVLFQNSDSFSIAITPHRFRTNLKYREKYGLYNVSFQTFKNDEIGLSCLKKWKDDCINWCYDRYEQDKFADQKYLDIWPALYSNVKEFRIGASAAPWNILDSDISVNSSGKILIKNEPLICFHFHGLRNISTNWLAIGLKEYNVFKRNKLIKYIYSEYVSSISVSSINNSKIIRGTHPKLGRIIFNLFLADLYYFTNGKLIRICNFNFTRSIYSYLKQFTLWHN